MSAEPPGRIPFEDIASSQSWLPPQVSGRVINGDEQNKRKVKAGKRKSEQQKRTQPDEPVVTEEVVAPEQPPAAMITAGELESITKAAEQDGFEKGYGEGLEQGKQEGRKTGYSDGLKAGTDQANSEHGQWLKEQGDHLHALSSALVAPISAQQKELADVTLDLALSLSRYILDAELTLDPKKIVPIVDKAIAALPPVETGLKLYLHPDDLEAYKTHGPAAIAHDAMCEDDSLERGSCRVHSDNSFVEYSVADRLQEFADDIAQKNYDEQAAQQPVETFARTSDINEVTQLSAMASDRVDRPDSVRDELADVSDDGHESRDLDTVHDDSMSLDHPQSTKPDTGESVLLASHAEENNPKESIRESNKKEKVESEEEKPKESQRGSASGKNFSRMKISDQEHNTESSAGNVVPEGDNDA